MASIYTLYHPSVSSYQSSQKFQPQGTLQSEVPSSIIRDVLSTLKSCNVRFTQMTMVVTCLSQIPSLARISEIALERISFCKKPGFSAAFVLDIAELVALIRGENEKLLSDPLELIHLASNVLTRGTKIVRWLEKAGFISLAESYLWQLKLIGHVSTFVRASSRLVQAEVELVSLKNVGCCLMKATAALIAVYTVFYASTFLSVVQFGLLASNMVLSDK